MSQKIVIVNPALTQDHKEQIEQIVKKSGYQVVFCASNEEALPEIVDAQAAYGKGADLTSAGKELEWFHSVSAGVDMYLPEGAVANPGMILTNSSGAYGVTLAEHALMVTLEILRRQPVFERAAVRHEWLMPLPQRTIKDSVVTILGTGDIGREIAKRIGAFDPMEIIGVNRSGTGRGRLFDRIVKKSKVEQILPETDILIMCLPGTEDTLRFMNSERIGLLPGHAVLVNVGRGNTLEQAAVEQALRAGKLAAAALDVFESEPLPKDSSLWECPNLLITPHSAGNLTAPYTLERNFEIFCENLVNFLDGRPLSHIVDRTRGY